MAILTIKPGTAQLAANRTAMTERLTDLRAVREALVLELAANYNETSAGTVAVAEREIATLEQALEAMKELEHVAMRDDLVARLAEERKALVTLQEAAEKVFKEEREAHAVWEAAFKALNVAKRPVEAQIGVVEHIELRLRKEFGYTPGQGDES